MSGHSSQLVRDLIDQQLHGVEVVGALRRFAAEFGWRPSDELDRYAGTEDFCNGHLVVEHGFDRTAVISFLRSDTPYQDLTAAKRRTLLELSYNNLVDWHLLPERSGMRVVFNRTDPPTDTFFATTGQDDVWRSDAFDRLTGKRPSPNVKSLDDALIATVSFWKRAIQTDLGTSITLAQISATINAVILVRALEDYRRPSATVPGVLLHSITHGGATTVHSAVVQSLSVLGQSTLPPWLQVMISELRALDAWDAPSLRALCLDFYRSRFSAYKYNFHLISKHALSRIYEHYVSLLRDNESPDLVLFRDLPEEVQSKDLGSVYTPQYIARFFARYLREHKTPRAFRQMRVLDPACGSGMFLRTLLEMQCNPSDEGVTSHTIQAAFSRTHGIDVDENACQAARLSLALLHLVLTDGFPNELPIATAEAIEHLQAQPDSMFDAIIANPPFVKWDNLSASIRERLTSFMMESGFGKQDLYLAFLKAAIDHSAPGAAICFVLPHSFLLSKGATALRQTLSEQFAIRVIVDLSEIPVFEQTGSYVILLIAEKTHGAQEPAIVAKCRDFVGAALQDTLVGRVRKTAGYDVFEASQSTFHRPRWTLLRSEEERVQRSILQHPPIERFFDVRQGVITGLDEVFIRPSRECPREERAVWRPLLADRDMERYAVPNRQTCAVFMPFDVNGKKLTEPALKKEFPQTWRYLGDHKKLLLDRSTVKNGRPWWEPAWPRSPEKIFVPKLVTPHLILLPRFAVDKEGKYAISRSPYMVPKNTSGGLTILKLLCAVLNSAIGHWQLASSSHKYSRGYLKLEVLTLRDVRMPDPVTLNPLLTRRIVHIVDELANAEERLAAAGELDRLVGDAFGLSPQELVTLGVKE